MFSPGTLALLPVLLIHSSVQIDPGRPQDRSLKEWIQTLRHGPTPAERASAAIAIRRFGPRARQAVPALIKTLREESSDFVLQHTLVTPSGLGSDAKPSVPIIVFLMQRGLGRLADSALLTLRQLGPHACDSIPDLIATLHQRDALVPRFRRELILALHTIGPDDDRVTRVLEESLTDPDRGVRINAAWSLWKRSTHPRKRFVSIVSQQLSDTDKDVRIAALVVLQHMGQEAQAVYPEVIKTLLAPQASVRRRAIIALQKLKVRNRKVIAALQGALHDTDWYVRSLAASSLGECSSISTVAILDLVEALNDPHGFVRVDAAFALWRTTPRYTQRASDVIAEVLETEQNVYIKGYAAQRLGEMGAGAKSAVPALVRASKDQDDEVSGPATQALKRIRSTMKPP
jgi:HEAT repeat protein